MIILTKYIQPRIRQALPIDTQPPQLTPGQSIQRAIQDGRVDLVQEVLEDTAFDLNAPCDPEEHESVSPLIVALRTGNPEIVALIMQQPRFELVRSLPPFDAFAWARSCSLEVLALFLACPASDANQQDGNGRALLHEVIHDKDGLKKLQRLLDMENIIVDIKQSDDSTPLYQAALHGNLDAVELLLQYPVDVNNHNNINRWTVLMCAVSQNHVAIAEKLLKQKEIKVNASDDFQNSALHIAAERGYLQMVTLLLEHPGIEINAKNHIGMMALTKAVFVGSVEIVERLLARPELEINLVDNDRQSALYWAASVGNLEMIRLLLTHPHINLMITNRPSKYTACGIAEVLGFDAMAALLKQEMKISVDVDELSANDSYKERVIESPSAPTQPIIPGDS